MVTSYCTTGMSFARTLFPKYTSAFFWDSDVAHHNKLRSRDQIRTSGQKIFMVNSVWRIRIQDLKNFVTDLDPGRTLKQQNLTDPHPGIKGFSTRKILKI